VPAQYRDLVADVLAKEVGDRDVAPVVAVEVADRNRAGLVASGEVLRLAEGAVAVSEQYRDVAGEVVGNGEVALAAVEASDRDRAGLMARREVLRSAEATGAISQQHVGGVGDDRQVRVGVPVEFADRDPDCVIAGGEVPGGAEGAERLDGEGADADADADRDKQQLVPAVNGDAGAHLHFRPQARTRRGPRHPGKPQQDHRAPPMTRAGEDPKASFPSGLPGYRGGRI
jgi:hypothetical protein